jgi:hypothetical protein
MDMAISVRCNNFMVEFARKFFPNGGHSMVRYAHVHFSCMQVGDRKAQVSRLLMISDLNDNKYQWSSAGRKGHTPADTRRSATKGENSMMSQSKGPLCQSCAMPLNSSQMFGTNSDGTKTDEFCAYCYQKGQFTAPHITMQEMIDKCVSIMSKQHIMPEDQARDLMIKTIPILKRWRNG